MTTTTPIAVLDGYAATTTTTTAEAATGLSTTLAKESAWNPRLPIELAEGLEDPAMFSDFAGHWASMYGFILEEMPLMALWTLREDFLSRRGYVGTALMNNKFRSHAYTSAEGIFTQSARKNSQTATAAVMDSQHTAAQAALLQSTATATPFAHQDAREHDRRSVSRLRWEKANGDERVFAALSNTNENSISRIGDSPPITTSPAPTVFESAQPNPQTRWPPRPLVLSSSHANDQRTSPRGPRSLSCIPKTHNGAQLPRSPIIGSPSDPKHQGRSPLARTPRVPFPTSTERGQQHGDDDGEPSAHIVGALSLRGSKPSGSPKPYIGLKIDLPCPPHREWQHGDDENSSESRELESSERGITPPVYVRRNNECSSRATEGNIPYHDERDKIPNRRPGEYITRFHNKREAHASNQCAFNATGLDKTRKGALLPRLSANGSPWDPSRQGDAPHYRTLGVQPSSPADQARQRNSDGKPSEPSARTIAALSSGSPKPSIGLGTEPPYALHREWRSTERENGSASCTLVLSKRGNPPPVYLRTSDEFSSCVNEGIDPYRDEGDRLPNRHLDTCAYIIHLRNERRSHATNAGTPSALSTEKTRRGALLPRYLHAGLHPESNYQGHFPGHDTLSVYSTGSPEQRRRRDDDDTADESHEPAVIVQAAEALSFDEPPSSPYREWQPTSVENGSQSRTLESSHQEDTPPAYLRNNDAYSSCVHKGNRPYRDERDNIPRCRSGTYITRSRSNKCEPHVTDQRASGVNSPEKTRKGVLLPRLLQTGISPDSNYQGLSPGYSTPSVQSTSSPEQDRRRDDDTAKRYATIAQAAGALSIGEPPCLLHREWQPTSLKDGLQGRKLESAQRAGTLPVHLGENDEHSSCTVKGNVPYHDERDKTPNRRPGAYITRVHNKPEAHASNLGAFSALDLDKTRKGASLPCLPSTGSPRDPTCQGDAHLTSPAEQGRQRDSIGKAIEPCARTIDTQLPGGPKPSIGLGIEPPYALHRQWRSIGHENGSQSRALEFSQQGSSPPAYLCKNDEFSSCANKESFPYDSERDRFPDHYPASSTTNPSSGPSNHHDAERRIRGPRTRQTRSLINGTDAARTRPKNHNDSTLIPFTNGDAQRPQHSYNEWTIDRKMERQARSSHTPTPHNRARDDAGCDIQPIRTAIKADDRPHSQDLSMFYVHAMDDNRTTASSAQDSGESSTRGGVPARYTDGYEIHVKGTHASGTHSPKSNESRGLATDTHSYGSSRACRENRKPESITKTMPDDGRRKGNISACHTRSLIPDGFNENTTNSQRGKDLGKSKVNPNIVHAPSAYLQPNRDGAASSDEDDAEHRSEDSYAMLTHLSSALNSGNTHAPRYETGPWPPCETSQRRLFLRSSACITCSVKTSDEESSPVSGIFLLHGQESGWDTPELDWPTAREEKPEMNQHGGGIASYALAYTPTLSIPLREPEAARGGLTLREPRATRGSPPLHMGCDIPNVMRVVQYHVPSSLEALVQRFGRCVRNPEFVGEAYLLANTSAVAEWKKRLAMACGLLKKPTKSVKKGKQEVDSSQAEADSSSSPDSDTEDSSDTDNLLTGKRLTQVAKKRTAASMSNAVLRFACEGGCLWRIIQEEVDNNDIPLISAEEAGLPSIRKAHCCSHCVPKVPGNLHKRKPKPHKPNRKLFKGDERVVDDLVKWACNIIDSPNHPCGEDVPSSFLLDDGTCLKMVQSGATSLTQLKARVGWEKKYWDHYSYSLWTVLQESITWVKAEVEARAWPRLSWIHE
ncbi:hypothetical protein BOTBODRAFT_173088 [Botryobasidium botryosum FD-172 SS1]|uniref:Uncharacterized protein n=1 Tax=Botryobasidium botryosum (strain FD-172 SS1) TaxID=930990 RepID=A0A067MXG1_BOTB1|nr:hypothetical protein BOTBODRAFT_173088 [Botryobasidium botryosum FD-172 SS1]